MIQGEDYFNFNFGFDPVLISQLNSDITLMSKSSSRGSGNSRPIPVPNNPSTNAIALAAVRCFVVNRT